jgi:predicted murein hydrolase (TIGR00659 family)
MSTPFALWVYLSTTPLLWLTVTLLAWLAADELARASGRHPLVNPVLLAVVLVAALLTFTGTDYRTYFEGAQFVHFLLGPATVALAVPLFKNWPLVRRNLVPMLVALAVGSITAVVSAVGIAMMLGVPRTVMVSLAPKSVTAGIAMGIAEGLGGEPALTAVLVITTGILGAVIVTPLMNALKVKDYAARGFAVGLASHGIGTARAFTVNPIAGTFAGIAMGLNAIVTPFVVPLLVKLLP